jgi:hypothetical protein
MRGSHEPRRLTFSGGQNETSYPGKEDLRKGISTNNYGGTMPNIFIFFQNFKISNFLK